MCVGGVVSAMVGGAAFQSLFLGSGGGVQVTRLEIQAALLVHLASLAGGVTFVFLKSCFCFLRRQDPMELRLVPNSLGVGDDLRV